jgi:hypothetical protein
MGPGFESQRDHKNWLTVSKQTANDSVAQLVEQYTFNVWVLGSNPSGITEWPNSLLNLAIFV